MRAFRQRGERACQTRDATPHFLQGRYFPRAWAAATPLAILTVLREVGMGTG
jgi:hypothetical protein